jgi:Ca2+-binding EF-hand superfamily protein
MVGYRLFDEDTNENLVSGLDHFEVDYTGSVDVRELTEEVTSKVNLAEQPAGTN